MLHHFPCKVFGLPICICICCSCDSSQTVLLGLCAYLIGAHPDWAASLPLLSLDVPVANQPLLLCLGLAAWGVLIRLRL